MTVGTGALEELIQGKSLEQLASDWSSSIVDHGFVERDRTELDSRIINTAFRMAKPEQGMMYEGMSLASGGYSIVELSAVVSNDINADPEALNNLRRAIAGADYQSVVKLLGSRAEVVKTPFENIDFPG